MPDTLPVSCVITSYNGRQMLEKAVASVLGQSRPIAEIIIADDGSTDGSTDLIANLSKRYTNITPVLRERNVGVAANRDMAIRQATQPFITHLDGDDLFAPTKIEAEWRALGSDQDAVAYSYIAMINATDFWRSSILDPALTAEGGREVALRNFAARSGPIPRDMLMSKELYMRAGGLTHGVALYEDWDFKMRLATVARSWRHSRTTGTLYIHRPNSLSFSDPEDHAKWKRFVFERIKEKLVAQLGYEEVDLIFRETFARGALGEEADIGCSVGIGARFADHWNNQFLPHGRFFRHIRQIRSLMTKPAQL